MHVLFALAACRLQLPVALPFPMLYLQAQDDQEAEVQQSLKGNAYNICGLAVEAEAHGHSAGDLQGHAGTHHDSALLAGSLHVDAATKLAVTTKPDTYDELHHRLVQCG